MERLWLWFLNQRKWLVVCSHLSKPEIVSEHWLRFMAERTVNDLRSMKPLTQSHRPDYQVLHREDWSKFEKQRSRKRQ